MALQGDLQSFALPDVLRLLAGTSKSGRLGVTGVERTGDVWLRDGQIVAGAVSSSPHAIDPADVVFELLRFESGSFAFEDDEQPERSDEPTPVEDAIGRAEELVREWHEVESMVPSVQSWVSFVAEIEGDSTTISADHWRTLAVIGSGLTVRDLGDHFSQTDLAASRRVKALVEAGLVELGDAPEGRHARSAALSEPAAVEHDDLSVLRADDGPVVLETSEDALLPEPLPGAGTSFEGDLADMTSVDGRRFDEPETYETGDFEPETYQSETYQPETYQPETYQSETFEPETFEPVTFEHETYEPEPYAPAPDMAQPGFGGADQFEPSPEPEPFTPYAAAEPVPEPAPTDFASYGSGEVEEPPTDPFAAFGPDPAAHLSEAPPAPAAETDPFGDGDSFGNDDFFGAPAGNANEEVGDDPLGSTPSSDAAAGGVAEGDDTDRGALLNFLSTVKN